ncbi:MAG: hypothetical protein KDD66_09335 [Bdellovibrionales bacterium]|nr:hypothetical protein [Bdellovibrionales bacterium]
MKQLTTLAYQCAAACLLLAVSANAALAEQSCETQHAEFDWSSIERFSLEEWQANGERTPLDLLTSFVGQMAKRDRKLKSVRDKCKSACFHEIKSSTHDVISYTDPATLSSPASEEKTISAQGGGWTQKEAVADALRRVIGQLSKDGEETCGSMGKQLERISILNVSNVNYNSATFKASLDITYEVWCQDPTTVTGYLVSFWVYGEATCGSIGDKNSTALLPVTTMHAGEEAEEEDIIQILNLLDN